MNATRVIIDNLPIAPWYRECIPIIIGIIALIVSIGSLYFTSKSYRRNSRPFVWAIDFGYLDNGKILRQANVITFKVSNSPAKIILLKLEIVLGAGVNREVLFTYLVREIIRYPDSNAQWTHSISTEDFTKIIKKYEQSQGSELFRFVEIKYSSLGGGITYIHNLHEKYDKGSNNWSEYKTNAN